MTEPKRKRRPKATPAGPTPVNVQHFHVFLASPGDVSVEREIVRSYFTNWNRTQGLSLGVSLDVIDWENYASIGIGRPQELITEQTLERFRSSLILVVGLMAQRFGSKTGKSESGTEEECHWALKQHRKTGFPEMKWFFRRITTFVAPSDPVKILESLEQWKKVEQFKKEFQEGKGRNRPQVFYSEFEPTAFEATFRKDLDLWLNAPERPWSKVREGDDQPAAVESRDRNAEILKSYRAYLREAHQRLAPLFADTGQVMEEVFVELELGPGRRERAAKNDAWLEEGAGFKGRLTLRKLMQRAGRSGGSGRFLVLGDPGSGKSTLARHLCFELASEEGPTTPIPVFCSLPAFERVGRHPFHTAEEQFRRGAGDLKGAGLEELLRERAEDPGAVWLFLDGQDEVSGDAKEDVLAGITALSSEFPHVTLCALSRPIGTRAPSEEFQTAHVRPLEPKDQEKLLGRFLAGRRTPAEISSIWESLQTRPLLLDAARTPLLIALIARVALEVTQEGGAGDLSLPPTRHALYGRATGLLLERGFSYEAGATARGVREPALARRILRPLSWELLRSSSEVWTDDDIDRAFDAAFESEPTLAKRLKDVWVTRDEFLKDLGANSGILAHHDGDFLPRRFLHRQLGEFLAAECLKEKGADRLLATIEEFDEDDLGRLGETLGMACGLFPQPLDLLTSLRKKNGALALRVLGDTEGLAPKAAIEFLFSTEGVDGEDLCRLLRGFGVGSLKQRAELAALLWPRVTKGAATETLAHLHFALEFLEGSVDRERFFRAAGRWPKRFPKLEFAPIPAGDYLMGSDPSDKHADSDEHPRHMVSLAAFRLAVHAVTNEVYEAFDPQHKRQLFKGVGRRALARHPVVNTSWWEAYLFCRWIGGALPTESQWEAACRARTTTRYWSGDEKEDLGRVGWYEANSDGRTHEVGEKPANPFGLYDMHGNVWEWCVDRYDERSYDLPARAGDGLREPPGASSVRVFRGGGFGFDARDLRGSYRIRDSPSYRHDYLGFRPALPPS